MSVLSDFLHARRVVQTEQLTGYAHVPAVSPRTIALGPEIQPTVAVPLRAPAVASAPVGGMVSATASAATQSLVASRYPVPAAPGAARAPQKNEAWNQC